MSDDGKRGDVYDVFGSDWEMSDAEEEKASAKSVEKEAKEPPDDGAKESDDDDELYDFGKRKKRKAKGTSTSRGSTRKKQRKRLKRASGEKVEEGREPGVGNEIGLDGDSGEDSESAGSEEEAVDDAERAADKAIAKTGKDKRKKKYQSLDEMRQASEDLIGRMWKARDEDLKAFKRDQPALQKLKMLPEVEDFCKRVGFPEVLLQCKILGALRLWLDPMPDSSLPNQSVRTRVLKLLEIFPIDEEWKDLLRESGGLGKIINFLSIKDPYEPNRRQAKKLISIWSRQIFAKKDVSDPYERALPPSSIAQSSRASDKKESMYEREMKKSNASRFFARVPQPASLSFNRIPEESMGDFEEGGRVRTENKSKAAVEKGLQRLKKNRKGGNDRAVSLSIEGRGLL
mmetsp:Transcript_43167/g.169005  ORF Transcript_43167/g.169005 Transcript_43167/m.169005 type:complete len:401 (+) Transcript_43167:160-1362(+)|eukprot:CAMPEP_0113961660 /NCGR_PEP_ID=MMETSP0011_2-20120614/5446_1 /TAXON_ID=101924 /ORGANISM="Rhodosorus marinus" /LENGTH=400 /DNA_ID=CAMNT_0000973353 /DNA_START=92 /DNA_END=1294 /DNA_ORIENTATION=- /assembly_acc=CAM_ASM_000156